MQEKTSKERTDILANRPRSFSEYPVTLGVDEKSPWWASSIRGKKESWQIGKKGVLANSEQPAQARNAQRLRVRRLQHTGKLRRCVRSSQRALFFSRDSGRDPKSLECLWGLE